MNLVTNIITNNLKRQQTEAEGIKANIESTEADLAEQKIRLAGVQAKINELETFLKTQEVIND